jgi:hypothetical protein
MMMKFTDAYSTEQNKLQTTDSISAHIEVVCRGNLRKMKLDW